MKLHFGVPGLLHHLNGQEMRVTGGDVCDEVFQQRKPLAWSEA